MKRLDRWDGLALAMIVAALIVSAAVYADLPARVPVHFDIHGTPDGWAGRTFAAFMGPSIAALVWALVRFGSAILPPGWRRRLDASPTSIVALLVVALMMALQVVVLVAARRPETNVSGVLGAALSAFWIATGQILPRVRRNPFIGIRTTWTLVSDENWSRTHRFAGIVFTVAGIVGLAGALTGSAAIAIVAMLASALAAAVYSFVLARSLPDSR